MSIKTVGKVSLLTLALMGASLTAKATPTPQALRVISMSEEPAGAYVPVSYQQVVGANGHSVALAVADGDTANMYQAAAPYTPWSVVVAGGKIGFPSNTVIGRLLGGTPQSKIAVKGNAQEADIYSLLWLPSSEVTRAGNLLTFRGQAFDALKGSKARVIKRVKDWNEAGGYATLLLDEPVGATSFRPNSGNPSQLDHSPAYASIERIQLADGREIGLGFKDGVAPFVNPFFFAGSAPRSNYYRENKKLMIWDTQKNMEEDKLLEEALMAAGATRRTFIESDFLNTPRLYKNLQRGTTLKVYDASDDAIFSGFEIPTAADGSFTLKGMGSQWSSSLGPCCVGAPSADGTMTFKVKQ